MSEKIKVYVKTDIHSLVTNEQVYLQDIAKLSCNDRQMKNRIKNIPVYEFASSTKKQMVVFSALKLVELICSQIEQADIELLGEEDFIIEYKGRGAKKPWLERTKLALVCIITFFGSAFTIMAFNNDISINGVFERFFKELVGYDKPMVSELEIFYSLGLAVGILVFFNHLGRKKITPDPTPIQVELRKYENDMNETFIVSASRKGHNQDVD